MEQRGRHELKYIIDETRARAIAGYVRGYLRASPYNRPGPEAGESVISLYFDSPHLLFYNQAASGLKNRRKLRIRIYDNEWHHPAFVEIKRRENAVICKSRAAVTRATVQRALRDHWPSHVDELDVAEPGQDRAVVAAVWQQFSYWCHVVQARPLLYITYAREAYVGTGDGELRVTFDRQLRATPYQGDNRLAVPASGVAPHPAFLPPGSVVLELKFTGACPRWMQEMTCVFNLARRSASKYCACVEALGMVHARPDVPVAKRWTVA